MITTTLLETRQQLASLLPVLAQTEQHDHAIGRRGDAAGPIRQAGEQAAVSDRDVVASRLLVGECDRNERTIDDTVSSGDHLTRSYQE